MEPTHVDTIKPSETVQKDNQGDNNLTIYIYTHTHTLIHKYINT